MPSLFFLTLFAKIFKICSTKIGFIGCFIQLINFLKARPNKSIRSIESFLETSERTVYRYLDLLDSLGFDIKKDGNNKIYIAGSANSSQIPFTPQEADYLKKLILSAGKNSQLAQSILLKVQQSCELEQGADCLFKAHLAKIIEQISLAIVEGKQLLIKGYSSANSQSVTDRLVEPTCFTENYDVVSAFEVNTGLNKYFSIERITSAEVLEKKMQFEDRHEFHKRDIFGFQGKTMSKVVEWNMSMRACLLLKEEYPMSSICIKQLSQNRLFHFKANVESFKAPGRFLMGFAEDVHVKGSKEFILYINRLVQKNI